MAVAGYTANKNIYQTALAGGTAGKVTTGGTYANGIANLTPTLSGSLASAKAPTVKMPNLSSQFNGNVVSIGAGGLGSTGGGGSGSVTKEGAIIGGGAINTTFNSGNRAVTGSMGVTKLPSTTQAVKYSDFLPNMQSLPKAADSATTPVMTAQKTESTTAKPEATENEAAQPATYEEYLEQQKQLVEKRKADADAQAEAAKERAAVDAQASYAQNKASYGANAETLAQMGLQGGGYSDYIDAQAYAQKRADVQQANALEQQTKTQNNATYEDALSEINKSGIEYKEKQAEKQDSIYASLWEGAINPDSGYTEESVAAIGKEYGLSDAQITELQGIVAETKDKREAEKQAAIKQAALDAINQGSISESNLESYLDTLKGQGASNKDIADIRETYQSTYYNDYMAQISGGDDQFSTKAVDDAFKAGNLSQEHYDNLKKAWNDNIDPELLDRYDYDEAKQYYEDIIKNDWCSAETKAALEKSFQTYEAKKFESNVSTGYNAHSSTVTLNTPDGKVTVTYGVNSKSLKKSSGNAVFDSDVYKNAGSGQVFIVNGRPYVKLDNGDLGWVNDYLGQGAYEKLKNTYKGTVYDIS